MNHYNDRVIEYFALLQKYRRVSSSYLVIGPDEQVVFQICKLLSCPHDILYCNRCDHCHAIDKRVHPDLSVLVPQKSKISIQEIREGQSFLSRSPFQASQKMLIVPHAHTMSLEAANAFLKTLEEPPPHSLIFLITSRLDLIIPTIKSRCRNIFLPMNDQLAGTGLVPAVKAFFLQQECSFKDRTQLGNFLLGILGVLRDYLVCTINPQSRELIKQDNYEIINRLSFSVDTALEQAYTILKVYSAIENVNIKLAYSLVKQQLT